jgi:hypothetical protein
MIGAQAERRHPAPYETVGRRSPPRWCQIGVVLRKACGGGRFAVGGSPTSGFPVRLAVGRLGFMAPRRASAPCTGGGWKRKLNRARPREAPPPS